MAKSIKPDQLGAALVDTLTIYSAEVTERVNECGADAMKKLVKKTRATAPKGARGSYRKSITSTTVEERGMKSYIWHAKGPDGRLTHLLVNGHATKDGGRTKADPFLQNALDEVLPEYEANIKEAVKE